MSRIILHSDLNNFYASVECLYNPAIRRFPIAVCGDIELRHGIVLAKNQIAKLCGVKTGETIGDAKGKCKELIIVPPRMDLYNKFSKWTKEIYEEYADNIESFGPDENWIDVTNLARDEHDGELIADEIRTKIKETLGITCSIGVSFNKIYSKLASDLRKPDATTVISRDDYKDIAWKLPADNLIGVNRGTMKVFKAMDISTIGDIAAMPVYLLEGMLGKIGGYLHRAANGEGYTYVKHKNYVEPPKTIGNIETTPRDMKTIDDVRRVVYTLSESVSSRLREQHYKCKTVKVYIRENDLKSCDRQGKLEVPTYITNNIAERAMEIFNSRYHFTKPLRSIGVRACGLVPENIEIQSSFFDDTEQDEKRDKVAKTIDILRSMYGYNIIQRGITFEDKKLTNIPDDYNRSSYRIGSSFKEA